MKRLLALAALLLATITALAAPPSKGGIPALPDGSESAPALYFASDPTTGFFLTNGMLGIAVKGKTVMLLDGNRNVAVAGAAIGASSSDSFAAGRDSVANADCAIALGQRNTVLAADGVAVGHNNKLNATAVASFVSGADNTVDAPWAMVANDANTVYKSAVGAAVFGNSHFIGLDDGLSAAAQWSVTFGVANVTLGESSLSMGLYLKNATSYSGLFGAGINFRSPLNGPQSGGTIGLGFNTTTPVTIP